MTVSPVYHVVSYMADYRISLDWTVPLGAGAAIDAAFRRAGPVRPDPQPVPGTP